MKARVEITIDENNNHELRTNIADKEQVRDVLNRALKALGKPIVFGGFLGGDTQPDIRRPFPRNGKGCPFPK